MMSRLWAAIKRMFSKKSTVPTPVQPEERRDPLTTNKPILGFVIGHTMQDKGAAMDRTLNGMQEYDYNSLIGFYMKEFAPSMGIEVKVYTRDAGGIPGAYAAAAWDKCTAIIEGHFNSCDTPTVAGTETLCSTRSDDQAFAKVIQEHVFKLSNGRDRGVKVLPPNGRGAQSCYSAGSTPNCLVEPFFGSNPQESLRWLNQKKEYALALCTGFKAWCEKNGMTV